LLITSLNASITEDVVDVPVLSLPAVGTNICVDVDVNPTDEDTNVKSTLPIVISFGVPVLEPLGTCTNFNEADANVVPVVVDESTLAVAGPNVPSIILTTVNVSEFFKYSSAACDVKN
jgi:hypothetical protein